MTSKKNKRLHQLNIVCEIKEEFMILWQELSKHSKQDKNNQQLISKLLADVGILKAKIQNNQPKELKNEQN